MTYSYKYKRKNDSVWYKKYLSRALRNVASLDSQTILTAATILTYVLVVFVGAYVLLRRAGLLPPNAFRRILWRGFVYVIPPSLVLALEEKKKKDGGSEGSDPFEDENSYSTTRTFGAKSLAVKKILGLAGNTTNSTVANTTMNHKSHALPGLFNRDNECYQNSVIQGLASLTSFCEFVEKLPSSSPIGGHATLTGALQAIISGLNSPDNHGRGLWTPWALKSMSSWQQQDAQEYFSRVVDEVEKDIKIALRAGVRRAGSLSLETLRLDNKTSRLELNRKSGELIEKETDLMQLKNPLEGLQVQRVGCLQCGYVDGFSLIPFNCITVSLGRQHYYDLENLLDSYTDLETISGVECAKCTLLKQEKILHRLIQAREEDDTANQALVTLARSRMEAVQAAIEDQDFSEITLSRRCQVSDKARVLTNKTKQSVIARTSESLIIHVNRSVFDERSGTQWKNNAQVRFPKLLDLDQWTLGSSVAEEAIEKWETHPSKSMLQVPTTDEELSAVQTRPQALYTLRALITHYGTHGDGHYVAWRQDPCTVRDTTNTRAWWRLSDEEVVEFDEDIVLRQGGVFMLFYEKLSTIEMTRIAPQEVLIDEKDETVSIQTDSSFEFLSTEARATIDAQLGLSSANNELDSSVNLLGNDMLERKPELKATESLPEPPPIRTRTAYEATPIRLGQARDLLNVA